MLCDLAHAGPAARGELWAARADATFVAMLAQGAWAALGLSALAAWVAGAGGVGAAGGAGGAGGVPPGAPAPAAAAPAPDAHARALSRALARPAAARTVATLVLGARGPLLDVLLPPTLALLERCRPLAAALAGLPQPFGRGAGAAERGGGPFVPGVLRRLSDADAPPGTLLALVGVLRAVFEAVGDDDGARGAGGGGGAAAPARRASATAACSPPPAPPPPPPPAPPRSSREGGGAPAGGAARQVAFALLFDVGGAAARLAATHPNKVVLAGASDALARAVAAALAAGDALLGDVVAALAARP